MPNPDDMQYRNNVLAYNRAIYQWGVDMKGKLEQASVENHTPLDQPFVLGSYTLTTSLARTSIGTDVTNFFCSVVGALISKGRITSRNFSQT